MNEAPRTLFNDQGKIAQYIPMLSYIFFFCIAGQQTGLSSLATMPSGPTPGMNFCQSPDTIVGSLTTRAPSAKYVLARTIRLCEVHDIIYEHVQSKYPDYGVYELGDPRVRTAEGLQKLTAEAFEDFDVNITPITLSFNAAPSILAQEAAGFFYASLVL